MLNAILIAKRGMNMEQVSNFASQDAFTTRKEVVGEWLVYTTTDASGFIVKRVGYPSTPILSDEDLRASLQDDELHHPSG